MRNLMLGLTLVVVLILGFTIISYIIEDQIRQSETQEPAKSPYAPTTRLILF